MYLAGILEPMWLPSPTPDGVDEFKKLVQAEHGIALSDDQAAESATRVLHFLFIKEYGQRYLRPQIDGERGSTGSESRRSAQGNASSRKARERRGVRTIL